MQPIKLPIFYNNDKTQKLEDLGIDLKSVDCEYDVKTVIFFHIDCLSPCYMETEYTYVHSGGDKFICPYKINKTFHIIKEQYEKHSNPTKRKESTKGIRRLFEALKKRRIQRRDKAIS